MQKYKDHAGIDPVSIYISTLARLLLPEQPLLGLRLPQSLLPFSLLPGLPFPLLLLALLLLQPLLHHIDVHLQLDEGLEDVHNIVVQGRDLVHVVGTLRGTIQLGAQGSLPAGHIVLDIIHQVAGLHGISEVGNLVGDAGVEVANLTVLCVDLGNVNGLLVFKEHYWILRVR